MRFLAIVVLSVILQEVTADGNDWVNPSFIQQKSGAPQAQSRIVEFAKSTASGGPWTVFGDASTLPPNGDKLDYLSWAPYHWPDCNWCAGPRTHLITGGNSTNSTGADDSSADSDSEDDDQGNDNDNADDPDDDDGSSGIVPDVIKFLPVPVAHRKMVKRVRRFAHDEKRSILVAPGDRIEDSEGDQPDLGSVTSDISLPTVLPDPVSQTTDDGNVASGTAAAAENARKTQKAQPKATDAPKDKGTPTTPTAAAGCTPSPSKSLPPSATWTTCKYVVRDGLLNPDVRTLNGVNAIVDVSQSILYNAAANVLSGPATYAENAVHFMQNFFLDSKNGMHPRISYGQLIRGPGEQVGQYLGVIDFRGMVKVANAVQLMRAAKAPAWTDVMDAQMTSWTTQYVNWLGTNELGQKALSAPNNHGSFATNQLAAMNILLQDQSSAEAALNKYFTHQFLDQIAASGEQPFEAVRTRPFHYRCFNLEAMITNAKLGDQLGLDFWTAKSKYGATIKDALDFVLKKGPGKEDVTDIFPHVAAVAAAYGDPDGTYTAYLKKTDKDFNVAPYYFYNQPGALTQAPSANTSNGKEKGKRTEIVQQYLAGANESPTPTTSPTPTPTDLPVATPTIPWDCPEVFMTATAVQLDDGVFVTCDELKVFYGYAVDDLPM
ncbi:hypothetical protein M0805_001269 [Coniferiporia weirii]|nr:hypothetical protein M0805_001269 [Coniferiporia weirii]